MKNEILYLKCIDITNVGQGICKDNGLVIFVKEMLIGEEAYVKIISHKKNLAYGIIDRLIVKSPYRIESICPIAHKCGGCDFLHVDYAYQLTLKKIILENTFRNMNLDVSVEDVAAAPNEYYYRNKIQVPVKDNKFGFYRKHSNDIVEFDKCYIESEIANKIFNDVKEFIKDKDISKYIRHILIKEGYESKEIMLCLIVNDFDIPYMDELKDLLINKYVNIKSILLNLNKRNDNVILGNEEKIIYGNDYIYDYYYDLKIKINLKSFYQVNHEQMLKLYYLGKELANITKDDVVLDLFCGIGTISLYLAKYCKKVIGVEIVEDAIKNAKENALINNIDNAEFYVDDANKTIKKYMKDVSLVVVDPPRKGLSNDLINELIENKVNKILYISCNPATLARDLTLFKDYYSFSNIIPVDMFPNTAHTECMTLLCRKTL